MKNISKAKAILVHKFDARYVDGTLKYFIAALEKYAADDWDGVALKAGKFVESVTKALLSFCGRPITAGRNFKAGNELRALEQIPAATQPETIRIVIPKAGVFVFEVVNNRGGRHLAHDIDANAMDAAVVLPMMSWMLAEMIRFASSAADVNAAMVLVDELTNKVYPYFENIDGRLYVNIPGLSAKEIALLLLYSTYPNRIERQALVDLVARHGITKNAASTAISRLKNMVDDDNGQLKLRGLGRQEAEALLKKISN